MWHIQFLGSVYVFLLIQIKDLTYAYVFTNKHFKIILWMIPLLIVKLCIMLFHNFFKNILIKNKKYSIGIEYFYLIFLLLKT